MPMSNWIWVLAWHIRGAREIVLSPTEFELLALFLRRPRQVLTREIILNCVWGLDFEGSSNVMDVYIGY